MLLSEYNSKEMLHQYGIRVPQGRPARTPDEAEDACARIEATKFVVKAQIAAGGRGLAGGIKFAATPSYVRQAAQQLLGSTLVTAQTGTKGEVVKTVYVEAALQLEAQYYIGLVLDPETGRPMLLASADGGVAFEQKVQMDASSALAHVLTGQPDADRKDVAAFLKQIGIADSAACDAVMMAAKAFVENDMTLLEINPFARTTDGDWVAIDAKIALDASAAFRHPEWEGISAAQDLSDQEITAQKSNINYVGLTGNIGVVVNGAGLGLATNDMVMDAGGAPANFMDMRTTATSFDIAKGVELLIADPKVKVILLNVHGGGMTMCDTVAEGVAFAYSRSKRQPTVVARMAGQNAKWGRQILQDRRIPTELMDTMAEAVTRAVALAGGAK